MSDFDARAASWDDDPVKVARAQRVARALGEAVPDLGRRRVLEYGAGTGLLGFALQPHVARIVLADASRGMLEVARAKLAASGARNAATVELDLTRDPLPGERYDLVCTLMTLHHVADTSAILARFHALLAPGGVLAVSDLDSEDGSFHGPGFTGHNGFDRERLGRQLAQAGFRAVRFQTADEMTKATERGPRRFTVFLALAERGEAGGAAGA